MRNRWYHAPQLHAPQIGHERKAGWLELFYDLIYVAAFIQLGNGLSQNVDGLGVFAFAGIYVPLFLAWNSYLFFTNRFLIDDALHRGLTFLQMFGVGAMAVSVADVLNGDPVPFAFSYAFTRFVFVLFYLRAWLQVPQARALSGRWLLLSSLDCGLWLASGVVGWPWMYLLWGVGILSQLSIPLLRASRDLALRYPPDILHMTERFGLLTLIVMGESFVKVLSQLYTHGLVLPAAAMGGLALLITCSLWWIYFDDVAGSRLKQKRAAPFIWIYAHLPLTLALTGTGVGIKKALDFAPFLPAPTKYRWLLGGMLALVLLAVAIIDWVTERRQADISDRTRVQARLGAAAFVVLLTSVGGFMPAWLFVSLLTGICIAQILFDLMTAPLETDPHAALHDAQLAVGTYEQPVAHPVKRARDVTEPVVKGAPNELRRDMFFFFMEGSWPRFFGVWVFLFLFFNFVFGALYLLDPGAVTNIREGNLLDAFFFSVQTMATIGYGVMAPTSTYAHVLVTAEAVVGVLGTALVTGLMFAKAAKPSPGMLFSNQFVISTHHGEPTLMFRVGNARGNEIVDATISVTALIEELSPEGHKFRKLHDLRLRRNRSPLFSLSWTVIHTLDQDSPLANVDWQNPDGSLVALIVTLAGHDRTYGQNIYARHRYTCEDARHGYRFVDVISELPDGRLMVDYRYFHDVEPEVGEAGGE